MAFFKTCCSCFSHSTHIDRPRREDNPNANYEPTQPPTPAITEQPKGTMEEPSKTSSPNISDIEPASSLNQSWHYPKNEIEFQALHRDLHGDDLATQICFTLLNQNLPDDDCTNLFARLKEHSLIQQKTGDLIEFTKTMHPDFTLAANSDDPAQLTGLYEKYQATTHDADSETATQALMMMVAFIANPNTPRKLLGKAFHSMSVKSTDPQLADPDPNSTVEIAKAFGFILMYLRCASSASNSSASQLTSATTSPKSSEEAVSPVAATSPGSAMVRAVPLLSRSRGASSDLFAHFTAEQKITLIEQILSEPIEEPSNSRRALHSKSSLSSVPEAEEETS